MRQRDFVGEDVCQACHSRIAETYLSTNHHLTSQLPSKESIAGKFTRRREYSKDAGSRSALPHGGPAERFLRNGECSGSHRTRKTRSERIDFVTGSGEKGQTYLYWRGNRLFQLPVSYWTELHEWVNSPGFIDGTADFARPIVPRCLECHATYFATVGSATAENVYRKSGYVLGISCERCHGAGREHVERERACEKAEMSPQRLKPPRNGSDNGTTEVVPSQITTDNGTGESVPSRIVNPAGLLRDRQVEVCAQCHGGIGESVKPAFSYVPGQPLENYIRLQRPDADAAVDVHGNQVALTQKSRCYQNSQMSCTTCHEVYAPERAAAAYSDKS